MLTSVDRPARAMVPKQKAVLSCRPMEERDIEPAVALLTAGFPERPPRYWRRALHRLRDRSIPPGRPRYGYVMTADGALVGILLLIFSEADDGTSRGNVSSWYVVPPYRGFSHILLATPLKLKDVTLFNISPASNTLETVRAQGFTKYVSGAFHALAALAEPVRGARVRRVHRSDDSASRILVEHAAWGCLSFEVSYQGETYPFVFVRSRVLGRTLPCAHLVYCREMSEFRRFAGPLGRRLFGHGLPVITIDAEAPIPGLVGVHRAGRSLRVYEGVVPPRIGDLSYTELAIFGA
jgi:hypothetical protein